MSSRSGEVTLGPFSGLNNVQDPESLRPDELASALNVDIDDRGKPGRRPGRTRIYTGETGNLFKVSDNEALFTDNGKLMRTVKAPNGNYVFETLRVGMIPGRTVAYAQVNDEVYYTDGLVRGRVVDGVDRAWGVQAPNAWPTLTQVGGSYGAGVYQVIFTFVDDEGVESGTFGGTAISLASTGGIRITNAPVSGEAHVTHLRVYATPQNGDQFYFVRQVANGTSTIVLSGGLAAIPLETQFCDAPPPANILEYHDGRIYCARGAYVYKTRPLQYHLFKPAEDYHAFPATVTMLASVNGGMYVSADRIYWMTVGEDGAAAITEVIDDIAVPGAMIHIDSNFVGLEGAQGTHVMFYGKDGCYIGSPGGQVKNLTTGRVNHGAPTAGTMAHRYDARGSYVISAHQPGFSASDTAEVEVRRNGVTV